MWDIHKNLTSAICTANEEILERYYRDIGILPPESSLVDSCNYLPNTYCCEMGKLKRIFRDWSGIPSFNITCDESPDELYYWRERSDMGLDNYVYAFRGIHDPHESEVSRPVGIFLGLQAVPNNPQICNYTYRDLRSFDKWCGKREIRRLDEDGRKELFLSTININKFVAYNINAISDGDLWKYWGSPKDLDLQKALYQRGGLFRRKFVVNYYETIPLSEIEYILYPSQRGNQHENGTDVSDKVISESLNNLAASAAVPLPSARFLKAPTARAAESVKPSDSFITQVSSVSCPVFLASATL